MNIRVFALISFLLLTSCARRLPSPPSSRFGGIMTIEFLFPGADHHYKVYGNFIVEGRSDRFIIIFSDTSAMPLGEAEVSGDRVYYRGMKMEEDLTQFLRYWPLLFNPDKGRRIESLNISDIKINYLSWIKTEKGHFPSRLNIETPQREISIGIRYGS